MKSFQNWLEENHPEYKEGVLHNIGTAAALSLAAWGLVKDAKKPKPEPNVSVQNVEREKEKGSVQGLKEKLDSRKAALKFDNKFCSKK